MMTGPDPHDDTSSDHEQFEKELLAQDRDTAEVDQAHYTVIHVYVPTVVGERPVEAGDGVLDGKDIDD